MESTRLEKTGRPGMQRYARRLSGLLHATGRYRILLEIGLQMIACFAVLRMLMLLWFSDGPLPGLAETSRVMVTGFRFDLLIALCCAFPQIIFLT